MWWVDWIFSITWDISDWFFDAYATVYGWIWPFNNLAPPLYYIGRGFRDLCTYIAHFGVWVDEVWDEILEILHWDEILSLLQQWLDWAEWAWDWVRNAFRNVWDIITDWWASVVDTVKGWIDAATEGFQDLVSAWNDFWTITWPEWLSNFEGLRAAWDDFWTNTFPNLINFSWLVDWWKERIGDIQEFINTAFLERMDWWEGWQDIRDNVFEFFSNPLEWAWERFADWFLGPEE